MIDSSCNGEAATTMNDYSYETSHQPLYPSISSMPDIPSAEDVFSSLRCRRGTMNMPGEEDEDNDSYYDETKPQAFHRPRVQISPGHWVEMRGAVETCCAFQRKFYRRSNCPSCTTRIQYIQDAALVVCPTCDMLLPINDDMSGKGLAIGVEVVSK